MEFGGIDSHRSESDDSSEVQVLPSDRQQPFFEERMRATIRERAKEKRRRYAAYMAQEVECPACKAKATISDIAVMKSNGILGPGGVSSIDYLKCRQCKVHFGPPDGEVVMTGHDRIDMSM